MDHLLLRFAFLMILVHCSTSGFAQKASIKSYIEIQGLHRGDTVEIDYRGKILVDTIIAHSSEEAERYIEVPFLAFKDDYLTVFINGMFAEITLAGLPRGHHIVAWRKTIQRKDGRRFEGIRSVLVPEIKPLIRARIKKPR
jgi:hypothetical protein